MSQQCRICEQGNKVVRKLENDYINGMNRGRLAKKYNVSYDSVINHINKHLSPKLVQASKEQDKEAGSEMLEKINSLYDNMQLIFDRNFDKQGKKDYIALKALDSQRYTIELIAKIANSVYQAQLLEKEIEEKERGKVNIPIERLSKAEREVYFHLNRKLLDMSTDQQQVDKAMKKYKVKEIKNEYELKETDTNKNKSKRRKLEDRLNRIIKENPGDKGSNDNDGVSSSDSAVSRDDSDSGGSSGSSKNGKSVGETGETETGETGITDAEIVEEMTTDELDNSRKVKSSKQSAKKKMRRTKFPTPSNDDETSNDEMMIFRSIPDQSSLPKL